MRQRSFRLNCSDYFAVMPGLVPGIHVFFFDKQGVDGRDKPGHDGQMSQINRKMR